MIWYHSCPVTPIDFQGWFKAHFNHAGTEFLTAMVEVSRAHKLSFLCHRGPHTPTNQDFLLQKVIKHYFPIVVSGSSSSFSVLSWWPGQIFKIIWLFLTFSLSHAIFQHLWNITWWGLTQAASKVILPANIRRLSLLLRWFSLFFFIPGRQHFSPVSFFALQNILSSLLICSSSGELSLTNSGNPFCLRSVKFNIVSSFQSIIELTLHTPTTLLISAMQLPHFKKDSQWSCAEWTEALRIKLQQQKWFTE